MIDVNGVTVRAGAITILEDVSLHVDPGSILAVVGPNGAGKTTLLDVVCGMAPASGSVTIGGVQAAAARARVGRVFQASPLPDTLTLEEVASLVARDEEDAFLAACGLARHGSSFVAELSTGMRRIVDLAIALRREPHVLLLDEPASGLARGEVERVADIVRAWLRRTGGAAIVVEHDTWLVRALAGEVVVMDAGKVVRRGSVRDVLPARAPAITRSRGEGGDRFDAVLDAIDRRTDGAPR